MGDPVNNHRKSRAHSRAILLVLAAACLAMQGCMSSGYTRQSGTYRGMVIDATSGSPVSQAKLRLDGVTLTAKAKTYPDGSFSIGPLKCYHLKCQLPADVNLMPACKHRIADPLLLTIKRRGYENAEVRVPAHPTNWWKAEMVLDLGRISLQSTQ